VRPRGLLVTGTDTGVGKTVVAAAIVAALRARGDPVRALKPVITGLDEPADPPWPHDHELLATLSGSTPDRVALFGYGPAVSPALAGELSGHAIEPRRLRAAVLDAIGPGELTVVEGVGGLVVPLTDGYDVRALAIDLALPLVIAARPGLGTINHTLLTLEAARTRGLEIAGVVLTPWPRAPSRLETSNRATIEQLGDVRVSTLSEIERPEPHLLATAGLSLPLDEWLGERAITNADGARTER
jgi:dethiobiotin synthetase